MRKLAKTGSGCQTRTISEKCWPYLRGQDSLGREVCDGVVGPCHGHAQPARDVLPLRIPRHDGERLRSRRERTHRQVEAVPRGVAVAVPDLGSRGDARQLAQA